MKQLLLFFLFISTQSFSQVYVDAKATGLNDGSSWVNAYADLQDALLLTTPSEIWIMNGEYFPSQQGDTFYYYIDGNHSIYGSFIDGATSIDDRDLENAPSIINGDMNGDDIEDDLMTNKEDNALHLFVIPTELDLVKIDGLEFKNGAALITDENDETFFENSGGAILSFSNIEINQCNFNQNRARSGGGVYVLNATGGGIYNSTFNNNLVNAQAAGIMLSLCSDVSVENCDFEDNMVNRGALYTLESDNCEILDCQFINNKTIDGEFGSGAYFNWQSTNIVMSRCDFIDNESANAGAIYIDGREIDENQITIDSCNFINNTANDFGGGIYVFNGELEILNSLFDGNSSNNAGGAYFTGTTLTISNTTFKDNSVMENGISASPFGAGMYTRTTNYVMNDCVFTDNVSSYSAGGLFNVDSEFEINTTNFTGNTSTFGGGATNYGAECTGTYNACNFLSNIAFTSGGGSSVGFLGDVGFSGCSFLENEAEFGAGLFAQNDSTRVNIEGSSFIENRFGGGFSATASNFVNISECIFENNSGSFGGGINYTADTLRYGHFVVDKTIISNNTASTQGGGININNANDAQIISCQITDNLAGSGAGGGLISNAFAGLNSTVSMVNNTIVFNDADIGAGVSQFEEEGSDGSMSFQNNIFLNFAGLDYENESGDPSVTSMGGNLTLFDNVEETFDHPTDLLGVDPLFVDTSDGDYSVTGNSPAVNAGIDDGAHTTDLLGNDIIDQVDIGCYENQMPVSNQNLLEIGGIEILENPTVDVINFTIENNFSGVFLVSLINEQGQNIIVKEFRKSDNFDQFNLLVSGLPTGIYYLNFRIGTSSLTKGVVLR